ncbi:MAG: cell division protein ZapB [Acidobacteria bacterium]|nr:cell division protein ZapB [Acidobacteriota bacterium]
MPKPITAPRSLDLHPIDRLEDRVKRLVTVVEHLRREHARLTAENDRLTREVDAMRSRVSEAEGATAEMSFLREERDLIRSRVAEMLEQIEALEL